METVLITGATGFLGRELTSVLSGKGFEVIAVSSDKNKAIGLFADLTNVTCFNHKDCDNDVVPFSKVNTLIHCAFARSENNEELSDALRYTVDIFGKAIQKNVSRIINISSQSVYGKLNQNAWKESDTVAPNSSYALAKYATELLVNHIQKNTLKTIYTTNIRLSSLLMENGRFVNVFVDKLWMGESIRIKGGNQTFSLMDVNDAANGICELLAIDGSKWSSTYNLGRNRAETLLETAKMVNRVALEYNMLPVELLIENQEAPHQSCMDSGKFYSDTGWRPKHDLIDMIRSLFEDRFNPQ